MNTPSVALLQMPLPFAPARNELDTDGRKKLIKAINNLLIGDALEVEDRYGRTVRVERVDFYRYGDHYRIFHKGTISIVQREKQVTKANWYLVKYLTDAHIQARSLRVEECSGRCAYEHTSKVTPTLLLAKKKGS